MNTNVCGKINGFYNLSVIRNAGMDDEHIEDYGISGNLLTDNFFSAWRNNLLASFGWRFYVGTGTAAPQFTDTQLQSLLGGQSDAATVTANANVKEGSDYFSSSTGIAQWAVGAIVGNISEIGASLRSAGNSATSLHSRALILDGSGNPTTITLTATDQLVASYTLKYKIPTDQHVSVVDFEGVATTCTLETLGVFGALLWGIGNVLQSPPFSLNTSNGLRLSATQGLVNNVESLFSGGALAPFTISHSATASGRRVTVSAAANQFNQVGPIKYIGLTSANIETRQGIMFDPPLNKTNLKTLNLHFDYTLERG